MLVIVAEPVILSPIVTLATVADQTSGARLVAPPNFNPASPTVDQVAVEERVAALAKRSLKKASKVAGLEHGVGSILPEGARKNENEMRLQGT